MPTAVTRLEAAVAAVLLLAGCGDDTADTDLAADEQSEAAATDSVRDDADRAEEESEGDGNEPLHPPLVNGVELSNEAMPPTAATLFDSDMRGQICERFGIEEEDLFDRLDGPPQPEGQPELHQFHSHESVSCDASASVTPVTEDVADTVLPALLVQAWLYERPSESFVTEDDDVSTVESPAGHTYETARRDYIVSDIDFGEVAHVRLYSYDPPIGMEVRAHSAFAIADDVTALAGLLDEVLAALAE